MQVVIDIEANALENPTQIWVVVCKDIDTNEIRIFRNLRDVGGRGGLSDDGWALRKYLKLCKRIIGHNICGYDLPVLDTLLGTSLCSDLENVVDTLVVSRLIDYDREGGHSIEQYGKEFGLEKGKFSDWSKYSQEMEDYCVRDVDICEHVYRKYAGSIHDDSWRAALSLEQRFQLVINDLHNRGYCFDRVPAEKLLETVTREVNDLDRAILAEFPPREVLVREFTPKTTKFGTISKTSVPRSLWDQIHTFEVGRTYRHTRLDEFNPSSHKQIIQVLSDANWVPTEKTKTHIDTERELAIARREQVGEERLTELKEKLDRLQVSGWKINELNLSTLPDTAPSPARTLARRILLESRRRTLTEWLSLVRENGRIHGEFYGIGAWTHRMAHQKPNTANIPVAFKEDGTPKLLGAEMRRLWRAPKKRLLVGVDAEGIQLRIFAHYINDQEFTDALVRGRKEDKTDPHSLNQRILGDVCRSRQAAKRFIYALLLGAGLGKLAQVLECSKSEAERALDRILVRYTGFAKVKEEIIPKDARRGYFIGLDGRKVKLPGLSFGERKHLCMSGYLQNGEAIVIKSTAIRSAPSLEDYGAFFVDIVHDEFVIEGPNDIRACESIKEIICTNIEQVGIDLKLLCPLKGDGGVGLNWLEIH